MAILPRRGPEHREVQAGPGARRRAALALVFPVDATDHRLAPDPAAKLDGPTVMPPVLRTNRSGCRPRP